MKGSTLHRSGLTREKMSVLAGYSKNAQHDRKQVAKSQLNQYYKAAKAKELDLLWGSAHRGVQKVHNIASSAQPKSPAVFLAIGFVAGVLFTCLVVLIVSALSVNPKEISPNVESNVAIISEDGSGASAESSVTEEKYVVKDGDTLNGIAYRFYGKYNEEKINEIQRINNITNPASLRIGQELIIPVSQDR